jgi:hypothetical protein
VPVEILRNYNAVAVERRVLDVEGGAGRRLDRVSLAKHPQPPALAALKPIAEAVVTWAVGAAGRQCPYQCWELFRQPTTLPHSRRGPDLRSGLAKVDSHVGGVRNEAHAYTTGPTPTGILAVTAFVAPSITDTVLLSKFGGVSPVVTGFTPTPTAESQSGTLTGIVAMIAFVARRPRPPCHYPTPCGGKGGLGG